MQPEGIQALYLHTARTMLGRTHLQSAFMSGGNATYLISPIGPGQFGSNLIGTWVGISSRSQNLNSLPRQIEAQAENSRGPLFSLCPLNLLPAGTQIYTSGQDKDCLWHLARSSLITSRSAYGLISAIVSLRLPFLTDHAWILFFLGFSDFSPFPPCTLTDSQIRSTLKTKNAIIEKMSECGCKPSKPQSKLTIAELQDELIEFNARGPLEVTPEAVWLKVAPILLASLMLKPLDAEKVKISDWVSATNKMS